MAHWLTTPFSFPLRVSAAYAAASFREYSPGMGIDLHSFPVLCLVCRNGWKAFLAGKSCQQLHSFLAEIRVFSFSIDIQRYPVRWWSTKGDREIGLRARHPLDPKTAQCVHLNVFFRQSLILFEFKTKNIRLTNSSRTASSVLRTSVWETML